MLRSIEQEVGAGAIMATTAARRRFTVDDYHRMAEAGILHEDDRVELIDGDIVEMSAIGSHHSACTKRLSRILHRGFGDVVIIGTQDPVELGEHYEPEPDISVLHYRGDYYAEHTPTAADVILLIGVADSSLRYDREVKLPVYARAGIPEAWIVDLIDETMERHTDPVDGTYRRVVRAGRGGEIESTMLPGLVLRANDVLG